MHQKLSSISILIATYVRIFQRVFDMQNQLVAPEYFLSVPDIQLDVPLAFGPNLVAVLFRWV